MPSRQAQPREGALDRLLEEVRRCRICEAHLPQAPRPVLQVGSMASILIAGQAPGLRVDRSGIPFSDASGDRLREWMGVRPDTFYDPNTVALLPMGFCYPGKGASGDLPPRPECAAQWRTELLRQMPHVELILVIGKYAQAWHLKQTARTTLTETVRAWREYGPKFVPLPHPSPLNNRWLRRNPWFEEEVLPSLRERVADLITRACR